MKIIALFALFALASANNEYYNLPIVDAVGTCSDPAKVSAYVNCLLGKTPCTDEMEQFKKVIPEAVQQACQKCRPYDKHTASLFYPAVQMWFPTEYAQLRQLYDPENKYFDAFEEELAKYANYAANTVD